MKKQNQNNLVESLLYLFSFLFGIIICKFFEVPDLSFSKTIDLSNLLSILSPIIVALIFYKYLDKRKNWK